MARPALLFSGGKDSIVMLRLAEKAFWPAAIPFPVVHVDTGHNFPEVLAFRDQRVGRDRDPARRRLRAGRDRPRPRTRGGQRLAQPDPDPGPARGGREVPLRRPVRRRPPRRGAGPGQGAGVLLPRRVRPVGPQEPAARALGASTTAGSSPARASGSSRSRTGPSSTSGSTSPARASSCPRIYLAHEREVFDRDGMLMAVTPFSQPPPGASRSRGCRSAIAPSGTPR